MVRFFGVSYWAVSKPILEMPPSFLGFFECSHLTRCFSLHTSCTTLAEFIAVFCEIFHGAEVSFSARTATGERAPLSWQ